MSKRTKQRNYIGKSMTSEERKDSNNPLDHLGLVHFYLKKIGVSPNHYNYEDLFSAGKLALYEAREKHDPKCGSFGSYASFLVKEFVLNEIGNSKGVFGETRLRRRVNNKGLASKLLNEQELNSFAEQFHCSVEELVDEIKRSRSSIPLDYRNKEDGSFREHGESYDYVKLYGGQSPEELTMVKIEGEKLLEKIGLLRENQQEVIKDLYLKPDGEELSLSKIGVKRRVTKQRVGQIKNKAMCRLRELLTADF